MRFSLPTEAQWEFAARGGNKSEKYKYSGHNDIDEVAWYIGNSGDVTHPIGLKLSNELGLYDMSGNVYEWCSDWSGMYGSGSENNPTGAKIGTRCVVRGGCSHYDSKICRVSHRGHKPPGYSFGYLGLRLTVELQ